MVTAEGLRPNTAAPPEGERSTAMEVARMPWLATPMEQALHQFKGHVLLVCAPPGVGAFEFTIVLAQTMLCQTPARLGPCGACASCRWVSARSHPDLLVLIPEALQASLGWSHDLGEDAAKAGKAKPSQDIKVDAVRAAVLFAQTTPSRDQGKVIVIHPAEGLNQFAANALLKTLEESPASTRFILSCTSAQALAPTVRSRCQILSIPTPSQDVAIQWLRSLSIAQPEVLLAATGGLPLAARDWAAQGVSAQAWLAVPSVVMGAQPQPWMAGWSIANWVDSLQKLCHDTMCEAAGAPVRFFPQVNLPRGKSLTALASWAKELQTAARHADHPWNQQLAVTALLQRARMALE